MFKSTLNSICNFLKSRFLDTSKTFEETPVSFKVPAVLATTAVVAQQASAQAVTSAAQLASSVNLSDMTNALFSIAGLILGFVVISKGVSLVIQFVRRG